MPRHARTVNEHFIPHKVMDQMTPGDILEIEKMIHDYIQKEPTASFVRFYDERGHWIRWTFPTPTPTSDHTS